MKIHIFNPETDYALASFSPYYTPPAEVNQLRKAMELTPLKWAVEGDAIFLEEDAVNMSLPQIPGITLISPATIANFISAHPEAEIAPWGWNPMLKKKLESYGVPESKLPSDEWLKALRDFSHRRTSIKFNRLLNDNLIKNGVDTRHCSNLPIEFVSVADAVEWEQKNHPVFFKAPWSSSGRGIMFTDELETEKHIEPWLRGIIRRQGSVVAEATFTKVLDFATEWLIDTDSEGNITVNHLGISMFETSRRGKYHTNRIATQRVIERKIQSIAPDFDSTFIEAQRKSLITLLQELPVEKRYKGYLGIDMMADKDGTIRGCVEINFRRTMGLPIPEVLVIGTGNVGSHFYKALKASGVNTHIISGRSEQFPPAEIYLIAVKDKAIPEIAQRILPPEGSVVAHTSGSTSKDVLKDNFITPAKYGVFYPLQTFTKGVEMDYSHIPLLIEGSDESSSRILLNLAKKISNDVRFANSTERALYHVAAVMTCNFANHLCTLADNFLNAYGLDFKTLLPLLEQTVAKLHTTSPHDAQTGPAARNDINVITDHLKRLRDFPETATIYKTLTNSILNNSGFDTLPSIQG